MTTPYQKKLQALRTMAKKYHVRIEMTRQDLYLHTPKHHRFNEGVGTHLHVYAHHGHTPWKIKAIDEAM